MKKKPKIVALVPMRHESERVKQKNYRDFNGKPLFYWILETLLSCPSISEIYIDTDSPVIKETAPKVGDRVHIIDRPKELCGGDVPMNSILLYDVEFAKADYYIQTHTTNPLLRKQTIEEAIREFLRQGGYDSLFSVTKLQSRLWDERSKPINHNVDVLARTQDLPAVFEENSNIYIFTKEVLEKRKNRIGDRPFMFEINKMEAWDIDEELDFTLAELIHKQCHFGVS